MDTPSLLASALNWVVLSVRRLSARTSPRRASAKVAVFFARDLATQETEVKSDVIAGTDFDICSAAVYQSMRA
jgi:hypothetical protein